MAAATIYSREIEHVGKRVIEIIWAAFPTTDTTCTVPVSLRGIKAATLTPVHSAALAAAETLSLNESTNFKYTPSGGEISVASSSVTVARVGASVTSALKFCLRIEGY